MKTYLPIDEVIDSLKLSKTTLSERVAKGELKVYFWFSGLLREHFCASGALDFALSIDDDSSTDHSNFYGYRKFKFKGYVTALDSFFASEILQGNEQKLHCIRIAKSYGFKQITIYEEEMQFGGEYILEDKFTDSRKFEIIVENNLGHYVESSVTLTRTDCYFNQAELEKLIPTPPQAELEENNPDLKIAATKPAHKIDDVVPMNVNKALTETPQPPNSTTQEQRKFRQNDFRDLVLIELIKNPDVTNAEIWLLFKSDTNHFIIIDRTTLELTSNNKPITRKILNRCAIALRKIPEEKWADLLKR